MIKWRLGLIRRKLVSCHHEPSVYNTNPQDQLQIYTPSPIKMTDPLWDLFGTVNKDIWPIFIEFYRLYFSALSPVLYKNYRYNVKQFVSKQLHYRLGVFYKVFPKNENISVSENKINQLDIEITMIDNTFLIFFKFEHIWKFEIFFDNDIGRVKPISLTA